MNCPVCGDDAIPFIKAWIVGPWFGLDCTSCHEKLRVQKSGPSRFSSYVVGVLIGVFIALGMCGIYWSLTVFVLATVLLLMLDFFIDTKFVIIKKIASKNMEETISNKSAGVDAEEREPQP